jgi:hypothetical protein
VKTLRGAKYPKIEQWIPIICWISKVINCDNYFQFFSNLS